ncbi:hypothetical protein IMSAGC001_00979 [Bacteroides acidifaciens]|uniref:Uncharacterized protein n=1 Tax=Bacteroides acidifaciens TaxID=85831 RepID=A0A7I9ZZK2_9BACE|nr:hypothetical protein IMSAGC001_00979 [Bacteroides acidifaciens]
MFEYIFAIYLNKKRKKRNFACTLLTILSIFAPNKFRYLRSNNTITCINIKYLIQNLHNPLTILNVIII